MTIRRPLLELLTAAETDSIVGEACRTLEQLRRWFSPGEYKKLLGFGYQAVRMDGVRVLGESATQLLFGRAKALKADVEPFELYSIAHL